MAENCCKTVAKKLKTKSQEFRYFQEKSLKCLELKGQVPKWSRKMKMLTVAIENCKKPAL